MIHYFFVLYSGVSYAALMKKHHSPKHRPKNSDQSSGDSLSDDETCSLSSSDESDTYEPGFLDDPAMVSVIFNALRSLFGFVYKIKTLA